MIGSRENGQPGFGFEKGSAESEPAKRAIRVIKATPKTEFNITPPEGGLNVTLDQFEVAPDQELEFKIEGKRTPTLKEEVKERLSTDRFEEQQKAKEQFKNLFKNIDDDEKTDLN